MTVAGLDGPVLVRCSRRARRFTLRVNEAHRTVVVTVPPHGSLRAAHRFVTEHLGWLQARLQALPEAVPFVAGAALPLRGVTHELAHAGRSRGIVWTEARAQSSPLLWVAGDRAHMPRRLADWLKREARADIAARVGWHAAALGLEAKRVTLRDQTTRWGSCSSTGTLSFSWRLILAPGYVLDYVAAHEVAHLEEMNHGPRFWRLVRQIMPRADEARQWLKRHGPGLHRYGAEP